MICVMYSVYRPRLNIQYNTNYIQLKNNLNIRSKAGVLNIFKLLTSDDDLILMNTFFGINGTIFCLKNLLIPRIEKMVLMNYVDLRTLNLKIRDKSIDKDEERIREI